MLRFFTRRNRLRSVFFFFFFFQPPPPPPHPRRAFFPIHPPSLSVFFFLLFFCSFFLFFSLFFSCFFFYFLLFQCKPAGGFANGHQCNENADCASDACSKATLAISGTCTVCEADVKRSTDYCASDGSGWVAKASVGESCANGDDWRCLNDQCGQYADSDYRCCSTMALLGWLGLGGGYMRKERKKERKRERERERVCEKEREGEMKESRKRRAGVQMITLQTFLQQLAFSHFCSTLPLCFVCFLFPSHFVSLPFHSPILTPRRCRRLGTVEDWCTGLANNNVSKQTEANSMIES